MKSSLIERIYYFNFLTFSKYIENTFHHKRTMKTKVLHYNVQACRSEDKFLLRIYLSCYFHELRYNKFCVEDHCANTLFMQQLECHLWSKIVPKIVRFNCDCDIRSLYFFAILYSDSNYYF